MTYTTKYSLVGSVAALIITLTLSYFYDENQLDKEISPRKYKEVWQDLHSGTWSDVRDAMRDGKITYRELYQLRRVSELRAKESLKMWADMEIPIPDDDERL